MKNVGFTCLAFLLCLLACSPNETGNGTTTQDTQKFSLLTEENPEWQFENMRIYPIVADAALTESTATLASLKTTAEGMETKGFRIMELKQFGRESERTINALTVSNKSSFPVFLMSGDVVTGGKQDRVIAEDQVIAANNLKNIEVFCVEPHRWSYNDENASASDKKIAAFSGFYNVASSRVRHTIHNNGSQQDVWNDVATITEANNASSTTGTYAALDQNGNSMKEQRDQYIRFYDGKFDNQENIVGMVVVSGNKILGTDVFGHPSLFKRKFKSLLHGYATDALAQKEGLTVSTERVEGSFQKLVPYFSSTQKGDDQVGKFVHEGNLVHLFCKIGDNSAH